MAEHQEVELVNITPELAREWLGYNTHNRPLRDRVVRAYASDMVGGDWRWNGEAIKFAHDGTLLDGQHRLAAITEAGATVSMLVVRGLPRETQETMDGGAKRKFADVLTLRGEVSATHLAATIRAVALWEGGHRGKGGGNFAPTNAQLLQTLEKHPHLRDIVRESIRVAAGCGLPGSVVGLCWWLFEQIDAEDCEYFFARLGDGQGLVRGDAIYELRRTVEQSRSVRGERSVTYLTAITIKAWNAYRDGNPVGLLRFRPGGANPERFPEPR